MFEKYAPDAPAQKKRMTLGFAFSSPAHIIASFFGSGVARPASGTWGTLAGLLVYMALERWVPAAIWWMLTAAAFFIGAWAAQVSGDDLGVHDHSSIVIDEVFAVWLVLLTVPDGIWWQIAAFAAFRFFDIVKLPPARWFDTDARWQNGWGVMLDDAVAALQAVLLLFLGRLIFVWLAG